MINKRLKFFLDITIEQCKFVPKCWFNNLTNVTFHCYRDTYESLTHDTTITYLLVLMQLHLSPSFKGKQYDILVTQSVNDLIRYIRGQCKFHMGPCEIY